MQTFIVDSFTSQPFKGNPAGVCFPAQALPEALMQSIAMELGLSETAFVLPAKESGHYSIRYFSPKKEIPLCGHATLASASILFRDAGTQRIHFITVEGVDLTVERRDDAVAMFFPLYDTSPAEAPAPLLAALGITTVMDTRWSEKNKNLLLVIPEAKVLQQLSPDFTALVQSATGLNGVLVTAPSSNSLYDYEYRYFWPWAGTNEDPVTGGIQTYLARYWSNKLGKQSMNAFQCSERTGVMQLQLQEDRLQITGKAVIILEGKLCIPLQ